MIESVEVVVRQPGYPDRVVKLHEGATRLGRAEDNELVLSDVGVSRRHAQIYWSREECVVEDLGSGNGTYYQGRKVQSQAMVDGDEIVIDPFILSFRLHGRDIASAPPVAAPAGAAARLDVVVGTGMAGSSYPITARGLSIGRSEDRDVVIPDPAASRHHCQISPEGDHHMLRDMGSANGVFVNAIRVREQRLDDGDLVRIGNTEMRFVLRATGVSRDLTTQVNPLGTQGLTPVAQPQRQANAAAGGGTWLVVGGGAFLVGIGLLLVVVVVGGIAAANYESPPQPVQARALAWSLDLPGGLEGGNTPAIFESGLQKMRDRDHKGALQDFYRVLSTDPSSNRADKFALAAGEALIFQKLEEVIDERATAQADANAHKTKLLNQARRGGSRGRQAEAALREQFREDAEVVKALKWEPTDDMVQRETAIKDATAAVAKEDWKAAADLYAEVLAQSTDPDQRVTALAGLKTSRRELARSVAEPWRAAVVAEATGSGDAASQWKKVKSVDPDNPCSALQPR